MRKRTRRTPVSGLNPYQKAVVRRAWQADNVKASIHALIGQDVKELTRQAGGIIYAVMAACEDAGIEKDDPDVRILYAAGEAILGLAKETEIDAPQRELIAAGLAAGERLQPRLSLASIHRAAHDVEKASGIDR